jgi:signal transduction histidine kinase
LSIKAKQVAGVTTLVLVVVAVLSAYHLATLTRVSVTETAARGEMLAQAIYRRAKDVVAEGGTDPYAAIRKDGGVRSILESSIGYPGSYVRYAAIVDTDGVAVAHCFPQREGERVPEEEDLARLVGAGPIEQVKAVYSQDRTFEIRVQMLAGTKPFGWVRIGVSTILVRGELQQALKTAGGTVLAALLISSLVAMLLAQWMLRPIHILQSGLTRLGRGELDVRLELPEGEFSDLGNSFDAISAQITAMGKAGISGAAANPAAATDIESVMDNLEDAVALFSPRGDVIFCNTAMGALFSQFHRPTDAEPAVAAEPLSTLPADHPVRQIVERTLAGRKSQGPVSTPLPARSFSRAAEAGAPDGTSLVVAESDEPEWLLMSHAIEDTNGRFLGAMLVARNLGYLSHIYSTLKYSRKLAALGRLMAGVAHEVKNPLNAMTIHLELLKQKLAAVREPITVPAAGSGTKSVDLNKHVNIIATEIRRLDEVVVGFLKFARPDELKLQPVQLSALITDIATAAAPEAESRRVQMRTECGDPTPFINADPGMLRQALLNLALNGCQAMPNGGILRISCRPISRRRVEIVVEDSGVGIPPEHLGRIFDLYFTTKDKGSGIGLSMVYRIVQLHDGEVEVQSTPGRGTSFRLIFPQA